MLAQGVDLVEHGNDFQDSLEFARELATERGFALIESFHLQLVLGTATFALELLDAASQLDTVYVPIGMGSSICGMAAVRNALGLKTRIVGVIASEAPAQALSFEQKRLVAAPARTVIADGLACRTPHPQALELIWANVERIVEVTEIEISRAMRVYYEDTHNLAEGAGAASLAAVIKTSKEVDGQRVGIILTGGNVDRETYLSILQ